MPNKRKELNITGPHLWYLVGLITSDGCLSKDGRHINITSKEKGFLEKIKLSLGFVNSTGIKNRGRVNQAYYIQIANRNLYELLLSIGLMPNKSLKLGSLVIPKESFSDFLRGLIDGDGCLRRWIHTTNLHEQWSLRIFSGSKVFIEWLQSKIEEQMGCKGRVYVVLRPDRTSPIYTLKYGKMSTREIARVCYYKGAIGLDRKATLARRCLASYRGWDKSVTINN